MEQSSGFIVSPIDRLLLIQLIIVCFLFYLLFLRSYSASFTSCILLLMVLVHLVYVMIVIFQLTSFIIATPQYIFLSISVIIYDSVCASTYHIVYVYSFAVFHQHVFNFQIFFSFSNFCRKFNSKMFCFFFLK